MKYQNVAPMLRCTEISLEIRAQGLKSFVPEVCRESHFVDFNSGPCLLLSMMFGRESSSKTFHADREGIEAKNKRSEHFFESQVLPRMSIPRGSEPISFGSSVRLRSLSSFGLYRILSHNVCCNRQTSQC